MKHKTNSRKGCGSGWTDQNEATKISEREQRKQLFDNLMNVLPPMMDSNGVQEAFHISNETLKRYRKKGVITGHRFGGTRSKLIFITEEVIRALEDENE